MGGIIWLASYPKSGNTWLRAFLHNLLRNPDRPMHVNELDRFCYGDSRTNWYEQAAGRPDGELDRAGIARLRPKVHETFARSFPDSVFVKTHNMVGTAEGVPLVTMEVTAGAIYVVRNPLDVVLSAADHFGLSLDDAITMMADPGAGTLTDATNVFEVYGSWSMHVASWTAGGEGGPLVVRYEDMLEKPQGTFGGIARFLGLKPPRPRLDKAIRFSSFNVLKEQEQRDGFQERSVHSGGFFRVGRSGQWRKVLSEQQVGRMVEAHREQMQRFGYVPKGL